jgi:hypothetical protein
LCCGDFKVKGKTSWPTPNAAHPQEGYVMEELLTILRPDEAYF